MHNSLSYAVLYLTKKGKKFLSFQIPRDLKTGGRQSIRAKLSVIGGPVSGQPTFQKSEMIDIIIPKSSIFIQTDKPIYKPGQTGNFISYFVEENERVLCCFFF